MNYESALNSAYERLKCTVREMLVFYVDLLNDLSNTDLTSVNISSLNLASKLINGFDSKVLFQSFRQTKSHWNTIKSRDRQVLRDVLNLAYDNDIIDTSLFMIPFDCLDKVKNDPRYANVDPDDLPISSEDIDVIWRYLESIIKICANIIHIRRKPSSNSPPFNYQKKFCSDVNIEELTQVLSFSLQKI